MGFLLAEKGMIHAHSRDIERPPLSYASSTKQGARAMIEGRRITTTVSRCSMIGLTEQVQRLRADEFGRELFTIPAFEMLLELYTRKSVQPRSLTSLTGTSSASERNSQRIVHRLAARGFVELYRDPSDGRRIIVELKEETAAMLDRFFDRLVDMAGELPMYHRPQR